MEYDGLNTAETEACENEWLSVTYTAKKYLAEEQADLGESLFSIEEDTENKEGSFAKFFRNSKREKTARTRTEHSPKRGWRKFAMQAFVACTIVAVLVLGFYFIDGSMDGQLFETAKQTFLTSAFSTGVTPPKVQEIVIPFTVTVDSVNDGVITFSGGSVLLSFTTGKVDSVSENSVTVAINDSTSIVYNNLSDVLVSVGDEVTTFDVLGAYTTNAQALIYYNGEVVVNVIGSQSLIQWSV